MPPDCCMEPFPILLRWMNDKAVEVRNVRKFNDDDINRVLQLHVAEMGVHAGIDTCIVDALYVL